MIISLVMLGVAFGPSAAKPPFKARSEFNAVSRSVSVPGVPEIAHPPTVPFVFAAAMASGKPQVVPSTVMSPAKATRGHRAIINVIVSASKIREYHREGWENAPTDWEGLQRT